MFQSTVSTKQKLSGGFIFQQLYYKKISQDLKIRNVYKNDLFKIF
ncbi:hypothetical protein LEP1GSC021_3881 [Leptospira noguchii str. 1993005606]|uniref:Uncharacterized protein n=1 Tax=Leptospira noguchii str. 2001034031 TaxID=1193053 RepID=M6YHM7_9LEPT|nr:hypothetical protein LEP1GSC024_4942 [Leptospira noguchii str. 2001034031]EPE85385.1 hypothetical protein LEP1GSC021_3881 [Leptospira noguchii str. 1993005606]